MEKKVILKAENLRKTFKLSKKQQNIQKTKTDRVPFGTRSATSSINELSAISTWASDRG